MRLKNKSVVVTGGGSGIGAACCELFAREGAQVGVLDVNWKAAQDVAARIGDSALPLAVDITEETEVAEAMAESSARFGSIHGLVNSAGIAVRRPVGETDDFDWKRVIDVNLRGAFLCSKHMLPYAHGGSIVHISSIVGITGVRNRAAYSASKGGLVALMRNMAMDYALQGIRVNCVCPGFVRTPFTAALFADEDRKAKLTSLHALGRLGEPEDIALAVLFLLSNDAAWITGQALAVDGGFSAGVALDI